MPQPDVPDFVLKSEGCASEQVIPWTCNNFWKRALSESPRLREALAVECAAPNGGIRRTFVKSFALGDPVDLFLASMAWGFGTTAVHYPRQVAMLTPPYPARNIRGIVEIAQGQGAGAGWSALYGSHHIPGLGPAFGTKLLYFASYDLLAHNAPLVYDANVRRALNHLNTRFEHRARNDRVEYLHYIETAEHWTQCSRWNGSPEDVEYALFNFGRRLADDRKGPKGQAV